MKKILAFVLVLMLAASCGAAMAEAYPWSQWPVSDGSVKVSIAIPRNSSYGVAAEETWFWPWFEKVTGIDFEITQILDEAVEEQKSLMLASGDLPDVIWGIKLTTDDIVEYGTEEKILYNMADLVNEEVMPNLMELVEYYPDIMAYITASDGGIYTLPWVWAPAYGEETRSFISMPRMKEAGIAATPTTLDDFTNMLYAMKDASQMDDFIPLGGSWKAFSPIYYILNAMGFVSVDYNNGTEVAVRDGKAVVPATDPLFYEALTILKQYYEDGIIDPDFFSMDSTVVNAKCAEDKYGVYPFVPGVARPGDKAWENSWSSVTPLTSEWNDAQKWPAYNAVQVGGFQLSAKTEYAEEILRAFDALFAYEGHFLAWDGPVFGTELSENVGGIRFFFNEETGKYASEFVNADGEKMEANAYRYSVGSGVAAYNLGNYQVWFDHESKGAYGYVASGIADYAPATYEYSTYEGETFSLDTVEGWRASMYNYITPYVVTAYPSIVYRSVEDSLRINELKTVLDPYIESAIAQFIVGDRALNEEEFSKYIDELNKMGAAELNEIYDRYYQAYLSNLG